MSDLATIVSHATTGGIKRVYKAGSVPESPQYPYAVISASAMPPDVRTLDGSGNNPRRFIVQVFGRDHDSVDHLAALVLAAFDAKFLNLTGAPQCRVEVTSPAYRDPDDDGVLNITHTYVYH